MKSIKATIEGISPLLMHAYPLVPVDAMEKKSPEEQARIAAYIIPNDSGQLYVPAIAFQRALVSAATFSKGKGRGSLQKQVAACVLVSPEYLLLGTSKYEVDCRPVVIPATKGRVLRYRPRLDKWKFDCEIEYDDNLVTAQQVRRVVDDCGARVGLLDFRPEKKGPFGRFMVSAWE